MAWTLCSKEDVVDIHPIPLVELKDSWSDMVEGLIREYLDEPYLGMTQEITDEWYDGDGTNLLFVRFPPIASVQTLSVTGLTLAPGDYVVFPTHIELKHGNFPRGTMTAKVSYTSGSVNIRQTVRLAAVAMIVAIINYRKRAGADASFKWGSNDQKVGEESPNLNVGLTLHLTAIMRRTLRRNGLRSR